jgi:hypothetical protein
MNTKTLLFIAVLLVTMSSADPAARSALVKHYTTTYSKDSNPCDMACGAEGWCHNNCENCGEECNAECEVQC